MTNKQGRRFYMLSGSFPYWRFVVSVIAPSFLEIRQ